MDKKKELTFDDLRCFCQPSILGFETTEDIEPFSNGIIGQQRAIKAMDLGMKMDQEGYNIYMAGMTGTGKSTYARKVAEEKAKDKDIPSDICYVYNFSDSEKPEVLLLPPGFGSQLKKDMEDVIRELREEIPQAFSGEEYEEKKRQIMNSYQKESNKLMEEFEQEIREDGFVLNNTAQGPVPTPVDENGDPISQEEFQKLDEEKRSELREKSQKIQNELEKIMREIQSKKSDAQQELKNEEKQIALSVIQPVIDNLKIKYEDCEEIKNYLSAVQEDIIENLDEFKKSKKNKQGGPLAMMSQDPESFFKRYKVNLLVDNKDSEGAPVVFESNPTYYNLFGKIEGEGKFGSITTDFTMIKEGAVHKANGGYLILKAKDVLTNAFAWPTLKRALINQEGVIENIGQQYQTMPVRTLKPEPIPLDIKVILIGSPLVYQVLYNYDKEFEKLFKIKADFDVEMDRNEEHMREFASFIGSFCDREDIRHFDAEAVSKVIEYSSRLTGDREKMSTRFNELLELLYESDAWADEEQKYISAEDVKKAINEKDQRANMIEEKIQEMIARGHILVDVTGKVVGQINGLSVYQTGQYSFGRPSRITARTYMGEKGVINIEREVDMSGKVHNKGVMIMSGYLGGKYAQEKPLTLSASLAFEQSYGGVDGDSASCAELIALLSAISEIPVRQDLAITGSLNQKGKVQPIGGANQKIEGFYRTCKVKGITGKQGVVIPEQNKDNLMLKEEVIDAVEDGEFTIYTVENIDQAIELMLDEDVEKVHTKVKESLHEFAEKIKDEEEEDNEQTKENKN
ncbi:MAG: Lon protease family protein [bacterium]